MCLYFDSIFLLQHTGLLSGTAVPFPIAAVTVCANSTRNANNEWMTRELKSIWITCKSTNKQRMRHTHAHRREEHVTFVFQKLHLTWTHFFFFFFAIFYFVTGWGLLLSVHRIYQVRLDRLIWPVVHCEQRIRVSLVRTSPTSYFTWQLLVTQLRLVGPSQTN